MQKDKPASHCRFHEHPSLCSPYFCKSEGYDYASLYPDLSSPVQFSSYAPGSVDYSYPSPYLFTDQQEDLKEQKSWCLSRLCETTKEAEALRQENINLQIANNELNKQYNNLLMLQSSSTLQNSHVPPLHQYVSAAPTPATFSSNSLIDGFGRMRIGGTAKKQVVRNEESNDSENLDVNRVSLPKSISVRSNGYLKTAQDVGSSSRGGGRFPVSNRIKPVKAAQRVYVRGGKREEKPLELQVYDQGVTKTELCNKWQQTGACPYGSNCQFAHGIEELRPVLRHPRYKTEVCFMVLNGEPCPYGHRCHFRHSLSDQEKLIAHQSKAI
ncbi:zinc finger CCCH domain-containing protein 15 [Apium graveolens]|uniref:zinc finger CCCH domain-containing protein 15 n=1 Tax=Apium graveolens TaxID=4045 RepID=UPI003D7A0692